MRRRIRLSESKLMDIVYEATMRVLAEAGNPQQQRQALPRPGQIPPPPMQPRPSVPGQPGQTGQMLPPPSPFNQQRGPGAIAPPPPPPQPRVTNADVYRHLLKQNLMRR